MSKFKTAALTLTLLTLTATQTPAALVSRNILKSFFVPGAKPTSAQFYDLLDSYVHKLDDNIFLTDVGISSDSTGTTVLDYMPKSIGSRNPDRTSVNDLTSFGPESNHYDIPPLWSGNDGYLPLKFVDDSGLPHYGYLDMQMAPFTTPDDSPIFITSVNYESNPNTAITPPDAAPEPTTLSLLLLAAPLLLRRRVL